MAHNLLRMTLLQRSLALILLVISLACKQPVIAPATPELPLSITTSPQIMVPRMQMKVTCQLPTDLEGEGTFHFGISDLFMSQGPIDLLQHTRTIIAPCQAIRIACGYTLDGQKPVMVYKDLEPTGDCGAAKS